MHLPRHCIETLRMFVASSIANYCGQLRSAFCVYISQNVYVSVTFQTWTLTAWYAETYES